MTPVASWTPADYHRAVNRARAAWEATQPQLTIPDMLDGLDRTPNECRRRPVEPASSPAGSQVAGEPHRAPPEGWANQAQRSTRGQDASSPALSTSTAPSAEPAVGLRGRGQKGA